MFEHHFGNSDGPRKALHDFGDSEGGPRKALHDSRVAFYAYIAVFEHHFGNGDGRRKALHEFDGSEGGPRKALHDQRYRWMSEISYIVVPSKIRLHTEMCACIIVISASQFCI